MAYDQAIADQICSRIAEGKSLRESCGGELPAASSFLRWVAENPALAEQYTQARARGADVEFERLDELSDAEPERDDRGKVDPGWVQLQKLRIDTRKWTLARKAPKKYGEKVQTELSGSVAFEKIVREVVDPAK